MLKNHDIFKLDIQRFKPWILTNLKSDPVPCFSEARAERPTLGATKLSPFQSDVGVARAVKYGDSKMNLQVTKRIRLLFSVCLIFATVTVAILPTKYTWYHRMKNHIKASEMKNISHQGCPKNCVCLDPNSIRCIFLRLETIPKIDTKAVKL